MSVNSRAGIPGTYDACKTCPISLLCLSGRRALGKRWWCDRCRGPYYVELNIIVQCVVFRAPRGRYRERQYGCPRCSPGYWQGVTAPELIVGVIHDDIQG